MTRFTPPKNPAASLKGNVVVLTGGSSGIGAATVTLLAEAGAHVVFGDISPPSSPSSSSNVHYVRCDVRSYTDVVVLFKTALTKYGRVDHAIANAGLVEQPGWFDPRLGIEGVEAHAPSTMVVDVNLTGVLYFAHVACAYLAHNHSDSDGSDKSLTLVSSVAGFKESPGLFTYQASKFGVLGLMRALRLYVPAAFGGVRVNAVCPSMTETRMVAGIREGWVGAGLPVNTPEDLGKVLVGVCAAGGGSENGIWEDGDSGEEGNGRGRSAGGMDWEAQKDGKGRLSGRAIYVIGGECWDIEEGLDRTEHLWLGEKASETLMKGQLGLGDGTSWVVGK